MIKLVPKNICAILVQFSWTDSAFCAQKIQHNFPIFVRNFLEGLVYVFLFLFICKLTVIGM